MSNFHPLEVVDRASEPQLQAGENVELSAPRVDTTFGQRVVFSCSLA